MQHNYFIYLNSCMNVPGSITAPDRMQKKRRHNKK
jgi:hypothetical protein